MTRTDRRVAVVGAGVAGLGAARALASRCHVEVFEARATAGGHCLTIDAVDGVAIDVGFIVFNADNYPLFTHLLDQLGIESRATSMSFSVRDEDGAFEYGSATLSSMYARRTSVFSPRHHRFVARIARFLLAARADLGGPRTRGATIDEYARERRVPDDVVLRFIEPLATALWSLPPARVGGLPVDTFLRFLDRHGMLRPIRPLAWRTVVGGSRRYVDAVVAELGAAVHPDTPVSSIARDATGVSIRAGGRDRRFDRVILATHADTALSLLADADDRERAALGRFRYNRNDTWLHTDESALPARAATRASWNCLVDADRSRAAVTYWMNRLQGLPGPVTYCVTLNPRGIAPERVIHRASFAHPQLDFDALRGQVAVRALQGERHTYYCGAHLGFGFHEDGLRAGLGAAARVLLDGAARPANREAAA